MSLFCCVFLFRNRQSDRGYLLAVLLFFCRSICLTGPEIGSAGFTIRHYYFHGFIPRKRTFLENDPVALQPYEVEFQDGYYSHGEEGWEVLFLFFPDGK